MRPEAETILGHTFTEVVRDIPNFYDQFGSWRLHYFRDFSGPYWARTVGDLHTSEPIVLRIDDHCMTGFDLGHVSPPGHPAAACDCVQQSNISRAHIQYIKRGIVIHTPLEARGHGPLAKALQLKMQGEAIGRGELMPDTYQCFVAAGFEPPDIRDYEGVRAILHGLSLGHDSFLLLTNNGRKVDALRDNGINVVDRINVYDPRLVAYYQGVNFSAKVREFGHEAPPAVIPGNGLVYHIK